MSEEWDYETLLNSAKAGSAWPEADYDLQVVEAVDGRTSTGKACIDLKLRALNGAYMGKHLSRKLTLSPDSPQALDIFFRIMRGFGLTDDWLKSLGNQGLKPVADALLGRSARVKVVQKPWNDRMTNEIANATPLAPGVVGTTPVGIPTPINTPPPVAAPAVTTPPPVVAPTASPVGPPAAPPAPPVTFQPATETVTIPAAPAPATAPPPAAPPAAPPAPPVPAPGQATQEAATHVATAEEQWAQFQQWQAQQAAAQTAAAPAPTALPQPTPPPPPAPPSMPV